MTAPEFSKANALTFSVAASSGEISRHDSVQLVGSRTVALASGDGSEAFGLAQDAPKVHPINGESVTVVLKGAKNANVTGDVSADDYLVTSATDGVLRPATDAETSAGGAEFRALTDAENGTALVFLR